VLCPLVDGTSLPPQPTEVLVVEVAPLGDRVPLDSTQGARPATSTVAVGYCRACGGAGTVVGLQPRNRIHCSGCGAELLRVVASSQAVMFEVVGADRLLLATVEEGALDEAASDQLPPPEDTCAERNASAPALRLAGSSSHGGPAGPPAA
jgi:hypothetical protein